MFNPLAKKVTIHLNSSSRPSKLQLYVLKKMGFEFSAEDQTVFKRFYGKKFLSAVMPRVNRAVGVLSRNFSNISCSVLQQAI